MLLPILDSNSHNEHRCPGQTQFPSDSPKLIQNTKNGVEPKLVLAFRDGAGGPTCPWPLPHRWLQITRALKGFVRIAALIFSRK